MSQTQTAVLPASSTPSSSPTAQQPVVRPVSASQSASAHHNSQPHASSPKPSPVPVKSHTPIQAPTPSPNTSTTTTAAANAQHQHSTQPAPPLSSSHLSAPTPPPASATPPPPTNTCTHYSTISLPTLHTRFRIPSFLASFPGAASLPCADCRRVFPKKDMWVCLSCERGVDVRCGRGADSACAISHANTTRHGLVLNCVTRMIWCYFCDCEVIDEYDTHGHSQQQQQPNATTPQRIRHTLDPSDPTTGPDEEKHSKPRRSVTQQSADGSAAGGQAGEDEDEDEEDEENMTWLDYYMNGKGGEVGMSNLGNTSDPTQTLTHAYSRAVRAHI